MFDEFCKQIRFPLFVLVGNVYGRYDCVPCEQNQNRYENGLAPVNTGKFTFQKSDWFDRVTILDTYVNVALDEFRGSSYHTYSLSNKKFLSICKTCPLSCEYCEGRKFLSSCSKIHDMHGPNTISV